MILDFNKVIEVAEEISPKHVICIKSVFDTRRHRMIYLDQRSLGFDNVKPFAADNEAYYVCCPCCQQIEKVSKVLFKNELKVKIQCSSKKNSQRFKIGQDGSSTYGFKMIGYTVNLDGWNV